MKLLIISDIHSNYEALLAVAYAEKADEVWCLGGLVDYGVRSANGFLHVARRCFSPDRPRRKKVSIHSWLKSPDSDAGVV
jgi:hypothetical protein